MARTSALPSVAEREAAIGAVGSFFSNLTGNRFTARGSYWETTYRGLTVVVYKPGAKKPVNVAFTARTVPVGTLIPFANKGEFGKIELQNATMIIVSPNSFLANKQGKIDGSKLSGSVTTSIGSLPAPIEKAIKAANRNQKFIALPTGIFMFSQLNPGGTAFVKKVFDKVGLGSPLISSTTLDASNYKNVAELKAAFSLSFLVKIDNPLNRLVEATKILTSPKNAQPVLTLSSTTDSKDMSVSYRAPYLVQGKTDPVQTAISLKNDRKAVSWSLAVDIGDMRNPKLVPEVVELKGVVMNAVRVSIGFSSSGRKGPEFIVGFSSSKMVVKGRTTYSAVVVKVAMTPVGTPTGALIDIRTDRTVDLAAIADLAEVGFSAHPSSKVVPNALKTNIADRLQLTKLPKIEIRKPQIYVATPGMVRTGHLSDLDIGIQGAGVEVRGTLAAFDKNMATTGLLLDIRGLKSSASVAPFSAGPLALKDASFDLNARLGTAPSFTIHGKAAFSGVTVTETELRFSSKGFKWGHDFGCAPPMTRVSIEFTGFNTKTPLVAPSDCAGKLAEAAIEAGRVAAEQVGRTTAQAAQGTINAGKETGKWAVGASAAVGKFGKNFGCTIIGFFGGKCDEGKREAERQRQERAALAKAAQYRRIAGPAHCSEGWYWNHKYRNCWFGTEGRLLVYSFAGAAKGRCMQLTAGDRKPGIPLVLGDCTGMGRQQFTMAPHKNDNEFYLKTIRGFCLSANIGKKAQGVRVKTRECNASSENQRWRHDEGGRLVSAKGLCLRSKSLNSNGSPLIMDDCATGTAAHKTPPVEWVAVAPSTNAARDFHAAFKVPNFTRLSVGGRGNFGKLCLQSDSMTPHGTVRLKKCNRELNQVFAIGVVKGSYFSMVSWTSRMCLDLFAWKGHVGALIYTWPCHYEGNEQWIAVVGGENTTTDRTIRHPGGFMIKSAATGKCLGPMWVSGKIFASENAVLKQVNCNPRDVNLRFRFMTGWSG
tara:strand:+ start:827 stop:3790 length:2964 start_codon:yes stop_codon:yes gene_type:complete